MALSGRHVSLRLFLLCTLYPWQPQEFQLCEQRKPLVFNIGTPNLAENAV